MTESTESNHEARLDAHVLAFHCFTDGITLAALQAMAMRAQIAYADYAGLDSRQYIAAFQYLGWLFAEKAAHLEKSTKPQLTTVAPGAPPGQTSCDTAIC